MAPGQVRVQNTNATVPLNPADKFPIKKRHFRTVKTMSNVFPESLEQKES